MEYFNYLENFGKLVKSLRTSCKPKLSQVDFYKSLIPNSGKENENIKKKMNKIENGKEKNIDLELLAAIQNKYNFGLDYIFGLTKDYTNYDNKHYCEYFGLNEKAIKNLHKMSLDKDFDKNNFKFDKNNLSKSNEESAHATTDKKDAMCILKILNYILQDNSESHPSYSNFPILYMIYNYCYLTAKTIDRNGRYITLTNVISSDNTLYPISSNDIYLRTIKDEILDLLDKMRDDINPNND
jgi:transcriptional regulator with XRE-family HTH domain